jgi:glycosyltransferase involved in cell wall biosynthesis
MINKKILFFMPSIEGGGVEKNLFIVSNHFSKKFKNVDLITTSIEFKNKFNKKINIISPKKNFWKKYGRKVRYSICLILLIKTLLKNRNIKVFSFQANIYCLIVCKLLNVKIVVRSNSAPIGWSKNFLKKFIFKKLLKLADITMVNSIEFKKELQRNFNVESKVIYNPLNKEEIIKLSKKKINDSFFKRNTLNIINVGRFTDQKDHLTLLKAINLIKNKINLRLMIVGRGINLISMKNYIDDNSLKKIVKIINFTNNPFPFIKKSNLFILSSTFEGLPNVLLETLVLKKFIISSKCQTGPSEILLNGKGGLLFDVKNYKKLASKILYYFHNRNKCKKLLQNSLKSLHRFDSKKNLKKYQDLFKKL